MKFIDQETPEETEPSPLTQAQINAQAQAAAREALTQQILGSGDTSAWTGEGFGSAQANAANMAEIMSNYGITDIKQFGVIPTFAEVQVQTGPDGKPQYLTNDVQWVGNSEDGGYQPVMVPVDPSKVYMKNGQPVALTGYGYGNKETGQVIDPQYDRANPDAGIWSGTFAGKGSTGYGVTFDEQGNPHFNTAYGGTTGTWTNDIAPVLPLAAAVALAAYTGGASLEALPASEAAAAGSTGALESAAAAQAAGTAGSAAAQSMAMKVGTALGLEGTAANVVGNALLQGTLSQATGGDFLKGAITGGIMGGFTPQQLGGLVTESLSQAGIDLQAGSLAQKAIGNTIYGTLMNGGDLEKGLRNAVATYAGDKIATSTEFNDWLKSNDIKGLPAAAARGALSGGASSAIRGQDILTGAVSGAGATAASILSRNYLEDQGVNPQTAASLSKAASTFAASKLSGATDYNAFVAATLAAGSSSIAKQAISDLNKIPTADLGDQAVIKSSVNPDDLQRQADAGGASDTVNVSALPSAAEDTVTAAGALPSAKVESTPPLSAVQPQPELVVTEKLPERVEEPVTATGVESTPSPLSPPPAQPEVVVTDKKPEQIEAPVSVVNMDQNPYPLGSEYLPEVVITDTLPQRVEEPVTGGGDEGTVPSRVTSDAAGNLTITADRPVQEPESPVGALPTTPPAATPPASTPPAEKMPAVSPPATQPSTSSITTSSGGLPSTKLDSSPQFLAGAQTYQKPQGLQPLHQLFSSLTPALAGVLAERGFAPQQFNQPEAAPANEIPQDFAELAAQYGYKPEAPKFFADGGYVSENEKMANSSQKMIDSMMPKFSSAPSFLNAAPQMDIKSRLGALSQLSQGALKTAKPLGGLAKGGLPDKYVKAAPEGHKPEFITGLTGYYASGDGTGQSDDIPAMLHDGDYVIDADAVAALGDGSSKAGAEALAKFQAKVPHRDGGPVHGTPVPAQIADGEYVFPEAFVTALGGGDNKKGSKMLDAMREELREHKRSAPTSKIPPKAKSPLDYLKMAKG